MNHFSISFRNPLLCCFLLVLGSGSIPLAVASSQKFIRFKDMINELQLPPQCKASLKQLYDLNGDLSSSEISDRLFTLDEFNSHIPAGQPELNGYRFYSYTRYKYLEENEGRVTDTQIFPYLKKRSLEFTAEDNNTGGSFIYVANDPNSSKDFGQYLLTFTLSPQAKVLHIDQMKQIAWDKIQDALNAGQPELMDACELESLKPIILEDSGVDLIDYKGGIGITPGKAVYNWFKLLNYRSIESSTFYIQPKKVQRKFRKQF